MNTRTGSGSRVFQFSPKRALSSNERHQALLRCPSLHFLNSAPFASLHALSQGSSAVGQSPQKLLTSVCLLFYVLSSIFIRQTVCFLKEILTLSLSFQWFPSATEKSSNSAWFTNTTYAQMTSSTSPRPTLLTPTLLLYYTELRCDFPKASNSLTSFLQPECSFPALFIWPPSFPPSSALTWRICSGQFSLTL